MSDYLVHQFEVSKLVAAGVPLAKAVWNQFDEHGLVLSLPRLRGETNADYRYRLLDVMAHQADATYTGLVHGITRGLGLDLFKPLVIQPVLYTGGRTIARDPCVEIKYGFIRLYEDYANGVVDLELDMWEMGLNAEYIGHLEALINDSVYYTATEDPDYTNTRSIRLMNQMSRQLHEQAGLRTTRWTLDKQYIAPGTLIFRDDKATFAVEVPQVGMVTTAGSYHVDYVTGIVTSYSIPTREFGVEYYHNVYDWEPAASPVVVSAVHDEDFRRRMYEQILLDDGTTTDHLPTYFGVDIINELLAVAPMYWGS
tara:strand:- start:4020 stop:4952 length:933 start_codon:yes stop_codon:yes gene_type:complete